MACVVEDRQTVANLINAVTKKLVARDAKVAIVAALEENPVALAYEIADGVSTNIGLGGSRDDAVGAEHGPGACLLEDEDGAAVAQRDGGAVNHRDGVEVQRVAKKATNAGQAQEYKVAVVVEVHVVEERDRMSIQVRVDDAVVQRDQPIGGKVGVEAYHHTFLCYGGRVGELKALDGVDNDGLDGVAAKSFNVYRAEAVHLRVAVHLGIGGGDIAHVIVVAVS